MNAEYERIEKLLRERHRSPDSLKFCVHVHHEDGSEMTFQNAYAEIEPRNHELLPGSGDWLLVYTEHCGVLWFNMEDLIWHAVVPMKEPNVQH